MNRTILIAITILTAAAAAAPAQEGQMRVVWNSDYTSLTGQFRGQAFRCPDEVANQAKDFPNPGEKLHVDIQENWPDLTMLARWSFSTASWPGKYRDSALSYVLMCGCDADLMAKLYPAVVSEASFTAPLQFRTSAVGPRDRNILQALRGQEVMYEERCKAGFAASDYTIKSTVRVGLSQDGKTVFYYDSPYFISQYLVDREILFAAHDVGDRILMEIRVTCVMAPRRLFRDTVISRVRETNQYYIERLYALCHDAPSVAELENYAELLKKRNPELGELFDRVKANRQQPSSQPSAK